MRAPAGAGALPGHRSAGAALALLVATAALASCARPAPGPEGAEREVVVFAAASLRGAFTALEPELERAHPGVRVTLSFAGSQELRAQLEHGAAADVFASADRRHMAALVRAGRVADPVVFARNEPVLVVSREAAPAVRSLAELPGAGRVVLGAPEVPIGAYTRELLERASATLGADFRARVERRVVSREPNARQVLAKVALGEADAGIVYASDARAAPAVTVIAIPPELNVVAEYPIGVTSDAPHPELARAWVELLRSPAGARALSEAGFTSPPPSPSP